MSAVFAWGVSRVVSLSGGAGRVVDAFPNTNLFEPLTVIPAICHRLEPGTHRLVTCVMADSSEEAVRLSMQVPEL